MSKIHPFDEAVILTPTQDGRLSGQTSKPYGNMVGPFGGIVSSMFLKAVLDDERAAGDPVALTVNFCGSIADGAFIIDRKLQRAGKYLQHWSLELSQENGVRATATAVIGYHVDVFSHQLASPPDMPSPEDLEALPKGTPLNWINSYEMRFLEGRPNFTGKGFDEPQSGRSVLWIGDDPARALDYLSLASIADTFFLRNFQVRGTFPPMGTVTLTTYFHATANEIAAQGEKLLIGVAEAKRLHANFSDQQMELWGQDGTLLASGGQLAWYKE